MCLGCLCVCVVIIINSQDVLGRQLALSEVEVEPLVVVDGVSDQDYKQVVVTQPRAGALASHMAGAAEHEMTAICSLTGKRPHYLCLQPVNSYAYVLRGSASACWGHKIVSGDNTMEVGIRRCHKRGRYYIVESGCIIGAVTFTSDVVEIPRRFLAAFQDEHRATEYLLGNYPNIQTFFGVRLLNPSKLHVPVKAPYKVGQIRLRKLSLEESGDIEAIVCRTRRM